MIPQETLYVASLFKASLMFGSVVATTPITIFTDHRSAEQSAALAARTSAGRAPIDQFFDGGGSAQALGALVSAQSAVLTSADTIFFVGIVALLAVPLPLSMRK